MSLKRLKYIIFAYSYYIVTYADENKAMDETGLSHIFLMDKYLSGQTKIIKSFPDAELIVCMIYKVHRQYNCNGKENITDFNKNKKTKNLL